MQKTFIYPLFDFLIHEKGDGKWNLGIQFLQHLQGLEFREARNVETVVLVEDMQDALTLLTRESEKMHGGIIHTEKCGEHPCLFIAKEMGMKRLAVTVGTSQKVEIGLRGEG